MLSFGERLRNARERAGYTQVSAAERINLNSKTISKYERDCTDPTPEIIAQLIRLYNVSADYIMGLSSEMGHCPDSPVEDKPNIQERIDNLSQSSRAKMDEYLSMLETLDSLGNDNSAVADIQKNA